MTCDEEGSAADSLDTHSSPHKQANFRRRDIVVNQLLDDDDVTTEMSAGLYSAIK